MFTFVFISIKECQEKPDIADLLVSIDSFGLLLQNRVSDKRKTEGSVATNANSLWSVKSEVIYTHATNGTVS